jgi:hypothetical protein
MTTQRTNITVYSVVSIACILASAACTTEPGRSEGPVATPSGAAGSAGASGAPQGADPGGAAAAGAAGMSASGGAAGASVAAGTGGGAAGQGAQAGTNGASGTGSPDAGPPDEGNMNAQVDPVGNANRAPGFVDLSPQLGEPLPMEGSPVMPPPPAGWTWHAIDGAICRDGSPAGLYLHRGTGDGLLIFLEGGGACSNLSYCGFNPANVDQVLAGDGEVVIGSALGAGPGRQRPGAYTDASHEGAPAGIFDTANAQNPFRDFSQVYIPYCTGDVHFGTKRNGTVPNLTEPQQFVGYYNMQKFVARIVPTFAEQVSKVVLAGSSAGGFGSALNFSMVQDAFGDVPVLVLDDSGPPFQDQFMPVCMQRKWRDAWGLNAAMPPDCSECQQADGGGMLKLADFLLRKHPNAKIALISGMEDEVIRLFFSVGLNDCADYDGADPVAVVLLQADPAVFFPATQYTGGLNGLRSMYESTGRFATYYIGGGNPNFHQHLFRPRFYESAAGGKSIAQFTSEFLNGTVATVGP